MRAGPHGYGGGWPRGDETSGHKPGKSSLDPSNPPQGGSGVPSVSAASPNAEPSSSEDSKQDSLDEE